MDALDRTFRHLVQTIQARYPAYLTQPFEVAELYQNILPYRHHRRELGLETNQDYEFVLLQLLSGARDYLIVDEQMRERLARELAAPNPDPGVFRGYSTSQVALSTAAVRRVQEGSIGAAEPALAGAVRSASTETTQKLSAQRGISAPPPPLPPAPKPVSAQPNPGTAAVQSSASKQAAARPAAVPTPTPPARAGAPAAPGRTMNTIVPQSGEQCRYCTGALPAGRRITFCPHCGQNLTVINCLACGTELELGWKFCTTCGRPVSST